MDCKLCGGKGWYILKGDEEYGSSPCHQCEGKGKVWAQTPKEKTPKRIKQGEIEADLLEELRVPLLREREIELRQASSPRREELKALWAAQDKVLYPTE